QPASHRSTAAPRPGPPPRRPRRNRAAPGRAARRPAPPDPPDPPPGWRSPPPPGTGPASTPTDSVGFVCSYAASVGNGEQECPISGAEGRGSGEVGIGLTVAAGG